MNHTFRAVFQTDEEPGFDNAANPSVELLADEFRHVFRHIAVLRLPLRGDCPHFVLGGKIGGVERLAVVFFGNGGLRFT